MGIATLTVEDLPSLDPSNPRPVLQIEMNFGVHGMDPDSAAHGIIHQMFASIDEFAHLTGITLRKAVLPPDPSIKEAANGV